MSCELLPRENLVEVSPDFVDKVMRRIAKDQRRLGAVRAALIVGTGACVIAFTYVSLPSRVAGPLPPPIVRRVRPAPPRLETPPVPEPPKIAAHVQKPLPATRESQPTVTAAAPPVSLITLAHDTSHVAKGAPRVTPANCPPSEIQVVHGVPGDPAAERCREDAPEQEASPPPKPIKKP